MSRMGFICASYNVDVTDIHASMKHVWARRRRGAVILVCAMSLSIYKEKVPPVVHEEWVTSTSFYWSCIYTLTLAAHSYALLVESSHAKCVPEASIHPAACHM